MTRPSSLAACLLFAFATAATAAPVSRPAITGVSHIAVYAADMAKTERFYVHDLGATRGADPENPAGVRYYVSPAQFVEILPLPAAQADARNRLDHVAFATADAEGLRAYMAAKGVKVPARITKGSDGSRWFDTTDPEGNKVEFIQNPAALPDVPFDPLSSHIIHVGYIVHDRGLEDGFYRDVLGFRPYWYGGMAAGAAPEWVSQQVPDGSDWLEYMVQKPADGHGIPSWMSQQTAGVLDHFSLGVANIEATYTTLWTGGRLQGQDPNSLPKIGRDAKWQLNLYDPDGTRAEIMEFHAIGQPCCSPFTAKDPEK
jgi:catechol 2,3-dioxygenase-like lactoylglutathione lyase family enzyme